MTKVNAIRCPKCKDIIFSRARHDFHGCSCGAVSIDGGLDYIRTSFSPGELPPKVFEIKVKQSRKQLYADWNEGTDKFGVIKETKDESGIA